MKEKVETKSWKFKNENFEKIYSKRIWKLIKKKKRKKKNWKMRKHLESWKKVEKTRGFGQMVRLG